MYRNNPLARRTGLKAGDPSPFVHTLDYIGSNVIRIIQFQYLHDRLIDDFTLQSQTTRRAFAYIGIAVDAARHAGTIRAEPCSGGGRRRLCLPDSRPGEDRRRIGFVDAEQSRYSPALTDLRTATDQQQFVKEIRGAPSSVQHALVLWLRRTEAAHVIHAVGLSLS
jgi:hypothetical protein